MKRFGFVDKVVEYLKGAGIETKLIEGIEPDPSIETVFKGAAAMRKFLPDVIVAIGGGSPIDAAKACGSFTSTPKQPLKKSRNLSIYPNSGIRLFS
mgnify:CR=1 FL=1